MTSVIDGMKILAKHRSLRALLLGLALIASACAAGDDAVSTEAADQADDGAAETAPATDSDSESDSSEPTDDAMVDGEADGTDGDGATTGGETDDEAATTDTGDDGAETAAPASGPPASLPPEEAQTAAEQNIPNLQASDDVREIDVVSVYDGSITSLQEVVTGDRPVLLWFWAPH